MILLALDTCTALQSLAVAARGRTLAESRLEAGGRHSETLLAALARLLEEGSLLPRDLAAIAVTTGPGTFTGLRVGLATAKGLALASGIPLAGFSTLRVLAEALACESTAAEGSLVCALTDAGRGQLYRGLYRVAGDMDGGWLTASAGAEALVDPREAMQGLPPGAVAGGEGLARATAPGPPDADLRLVTSRLALAPILAGRASAMLAAGALPRGAQPNYIRAVDARAAGA